MRVMIQMQYTPNLGTARTAESFRLSDDTPSLAIEGFAIDPTYTPVQLPDRQPRQEVGEREVGRLFQFNHEPEVSTYIVRGEVADEAALERLVEAVAQDPNAVGVFSDPLISHFAVCPSAAVGNHRDVENLVRLPQLREKGLDGTNVLVAIVDTGFKLSYLNEKGKNPKFDLNRSWTPIPGFYTPGKMPVDHGSMCAFDVCIAAPNCTLLDYALLQSRAEGGSTMDGFLSDAVKAFSRLLELLNNAPDPKPSLVVNNSWGMYHPSWDFPVGHSGNYSDNPNHPFNIIVESLEDAGADLLFAAGNCGAECPSRQCQGATSRAIYGANSHPSVLSIGGVTVNKERVGYSSQGPGRLDPNKPDLCAYTHFVGSGVYPADNGTSAACPVAAGVVAAIRTKYPASKISPAQLRNIIRRTAEDLSPTGFDYSHGYGIINVDGILNEIVRVDVPDLPLGQQVSGHLNGTDNAAVYRIAVGNPILIDLDGPSGVDFDLYVRRGMKPTLAEYDARAYTTSPDERLSVRPSEPGEYYVMVHSYRGAGDFTLKASVSQ